VNQSPLTNANDVAAVIHHRVHRLTSRSLHKTGHHPAQIVGLVTPAIHVSDPTLIAPLRELESQIIERANWLADQLLANPPDWYRELRRTARTASDQEHAEVAREIAAYRERYQIQATPSSEMPRQPTMPSDAVSSTAGSSTFSSASHQRLPNQRQAVRGSLRRHRSPSCHCTQTDIASHVTGQTLPVVLGKL
jgi:hypothetical protein